MFALTSRPLLDTATSRQIDVAGDMDLFAASALRRALEEASTIGVDLIHVDLSDITWINGSALRHVANTRRRMAEQLDVDLDLVEWSLAVSLMSTRARLDGPLGRVPDVA